MMISCLLIYKIYRIDHLSSIVPNEKCFFAHVILKLNNVFETIWIFNVDFFRSSRYSVNCIS